jgi:membrane-associated phospholipid phosphatase
MARTVSDLTSPYLTSPLFILLAGVHFIEAWRDVLLYGGIAVGFTVVVPLAYAEHLRRAGRVDSVHIFDQRARLAPLALTGASSMVGLAVLYLVGAPLGILRLGGLLFLLAGTVLVATLFLKISGHASAWTAGTTVIVVLNGPVAAILMLGVLPIAWSRLALGKHTSTEVLAGSIYGVVTAALLSLAVGLW